MPQLDVPRLPILLLPISDTDTNGTDAIVLVTVMTESASEGSGRNVVKVMAGVGGVSVDRQHAFSMRHAVYFSIFMR